LKNIIPEHWTNSIYNTFTLARNKRIIPNLAVDTKGNKISKTNSIGPGVTSSEPKGEPLSRTLSQQVIPTKLPDSSNNGICGVYVTTLDAHTLTDGPTIYLASDVQKIAKFCIQQANIPAVVMNDILEKIEFNNDVNKKISEIEQEIQDAEEKIANKAGASSSASSDKKDKKNKEKIVDRIAEKTQDNKILRLREHIDLLTSMIKNATLNDMFIPNKMAHLKKWTDMSQKKKSFTCDIDEDTIVSIMLLKDVEDSWKILLLLGIGVFTEHKSNAYTEIMKKLADQQKLYLIIADSDYIYGTNYQFCHGYISKDLKLTQEKIIQAMGRIGRNNIQQEYSVRFRDNEQINTLFTKFASEDKQEVLNMNTLFNSKNLTWDGTQYILTNEQTNDDAEYEDDDENVDDYDDDDNEEQVNNEYVSDEEKDTEEN
jgi:hypothetical protein